MIHVFLDKWISRKFCLQHEDIHADDPILLISNHVTAWDPLIIGVCHPDTQLYFVASEHLFRLGFVSKLLEWLTAPIPRKKAASGVDTVKSCLRHLKAGRSVCLFAEGEQSWDGLNHPIFPATGKLAHSSGATLVTLRLEGGYLSLPRWGKGVRRGRMRAYPVGIYPPEQLKDMRPEEINALVERDISEDAWERQRKEPVAYRGKKRAEGMQKALYLCPGCRRIDTLQTGGDRVFCDCGLDLRYTETGFFSPEKPFATIHEWDLWQREALKSFHEKCGPEPVFGDEHMQFSRIGPKHRETVFGRGRLEQYTDRLSFAGMDFPLAEIDSMSMVQAHLLLMSVHDEYYQIKALKPANLRKYLEYWKEK